MRILMVHDRLAGVGGAERYVREIASALAEEAYELAFLTAPDQHSGWAQGPVYTVIPSEGWRGGRKRLADICRVLEVVSPDLVYLHNTKGFLSPLLLNFLIQRVPSVLFVHDVRLLCPNQTKIIRATGTPCTEPVGVACLRGGCCRLGNEPLAEALKASAIVRWRLRLCRGIGRLIAPSSYIAEELARNGVRREQIVVLPPFTERRPAGPAPGPDADLLWVGRFDGSKGFEAFADMLANLTDLPWRGAVVGDGEGLTAARTLVDRLGVAPRVSFLGHLADAELDAWYARARVVVLTSMVAESFCMVGIEAMAHGRPVVAFDVGGIREWLVDGSTGLTAPRGDVRALVAAVRRLLTEPRLADQLGQAGRAVVDARFRLQTHLAGLLSTFAAVRVQWAEGQVARGRRHVRWAMSLLL